MISLIIVSVPIAAMYGTQISIPPFTIYPAEAPTNMNTHSIPSRAHIAAVAKGAGRSKSLVRARKNPAAHIAQPFKKPKSLSLTFFSEAILLSIFNVLS